MLTNGMITLKIALISDKLTGDSLHVEDGVRIKQITPLNYQFVLRYFKPDLFLVESSWQGHRNKWKYKIASYSEHPRRNNNTLRKIVSYAKERGIPTVFWNKEDGIHFERFVESARMFDHIFTVDANCVEKYKQIVDPDITVDTLMFAVQPKFHHFTGFDFKYDRAVFVGSYSHHIHSKRRNWQDMMFENATSSSLGLSIFDRNSERRSGNYRYPSFLNMQAYPAVAYEQTAQIYKDYMLSLNVNTIEDSPTMFSRRLIEILACGGICATTPSLAVERMFKEYCHVVADKEAMAALFQRIAKEGITERDREMARAGAEYIEKHHTWQHRIDQMVKTVGLA